MEQLIYKKYYIENSDYINNSNFTKLAINREYQKQLWSNLHLDNVSMDMILNLQYNRKDLSNYFTKFNTAGNQSFVDYTNKAKSKINFNLKAGFNASSYKFSTSSGTSAVDFGTKLNLKLGFEIEYVLPVNRNKWAIYFEPTYQKYQSEVVVKEYSNSGVLFQNSYKWNISYDDLALLFGIRHYMYINDNSRIFINGALIVSHAINSYIKKDDNISSEIDNNFGFSYGLGYSYHDRYGLEFRGSNYITKYSLVFGYKLF